MHLKYIPHRPPVVCGGFGNWGLYWQSLAFSTWEAFVGTGMILGLLVLFRFNSQKSLGKAMYQNAYTVYIIHAPVIVALGYAFSGLRLYPLLKFAMVVVIGVPLCFLISHYLVRRLPFVNRIL